MKKLLIVVLATIVFLGCKNDSKPKDPLALALVSGTWRVNNFLDDSIDHTAQFTGYSFTFYENGELKAAKNSSEVKGSWSYQYTQGQLMMSLYFGPNPVLLDLNGNWEVNTVAPAEVGLLRLNYPVGTDVVGFLKN